MTEPPPLSRGERPDSLQVPPPAPVLGSRLSVATIGDAESVWSFPAIDEVDGPSFRGVPVLASDGANLAVVGYGVDGVMRAWCGQPGALDHVGVVAADVRLVALVRHLDRWHLYGADRDGRAWHGTSPDLMSWTVDVRFSDEHPLLVVHGATSMPGGIVVLGEVISSGQRMGWTLLEGAMGPYRAREITFPLVADHVVIGPVHVSDDEVGLVYSSGATHLVARTIAGTRGQSWTLGLLTPDVVPAVTFAHGRQMWVAGHDPNGGVPVVAAVAGRAFQLDRAGGVVGAATIHRDQMVLARCIRDENRDALILEQTGAGASPTSDVGRAQSSPAYIDSIAVA